MSEEWNVWSRIHKPTVKNPVLVRVPNEREALKFPTVAEYLRFMHRFWPRLVFRAEERSGDDQRPDHYAILSRFKEVGE